MNDWQPIETAPKDGTAVIVRSTFRVGEASFGICRRQDGYRAGGGEAVWRCQDETRLFPGVVTDWMTLPEAPQQTSEKGEG